MLWLVVLGSLALGEPPEASDPLCATSAFWQHVDESRFDLEVPEGAERISVYTGCSFVAAPGAVVDLHLGARRVRGVQVLGIRRTEGRILVAGTPRQAERLRSLPVTWQADVVHGGDWMGLLEEVERVVHRELLSE